MKSRNGGASTSAAEVAAAMLCVLNLACTPARLTPIPTAQPMELSRAVSLARARQLRDDSLVVSPDFHSMLFSHDHRTPRAFVLLHGFTDVPRQFEAVGKALFENGDNVYIPRLPHHAERQSPVRALGRVRAMELARFGDSIIAEARGLGDTLVVVGLSAGGTIAAHVVESNREVTRVVLIAPAIAPGMLSDSLSERVLLAAHVLPDVRRSDAPRDTLHPTYVQGFTTRGLAELMTLGERIHADAARFPPRVKEVAFLLNEGDHTVSEAASLDLAQRWFDRGAAVKAYRFPGSLKLPHNVMEADPRQGGDTNTVYPVVEALALGSEPPNTVRLLDRPCGGVICAVRHLGRRPPSVRRSTR